MTAYVIGQVRVTDPIKWAEYKAKVQETLERYGGKILLRGSHVDSLVGHIVYPDIVVIEFDSFESAVKWYNSDDYQRIIPIREKGAEMTLHLFQ